MEAIFVTRCDNCGHPVAVVPSDNMPGGYRWYCSNEKCEHHGGNDLPRGKKPRWAMGNSDISVKRIMKGAIHSSEQYEERKGDDDESRNE